MISEKKQRKTIEWERLEIKETFPAGMGMIKDRNGKDLAEVDEIKKRWQVYTEELQKRS